MKYLYKYNTAESNANISKQSTFLISVNISFFNFKIPCYFSVFNARENAKY